MKDKKLLLTNISNNFLNNKNYVSPMFAKLILDTLKFINFVKNKVKKNESAFVTK